MEIKDQIDWKVIDQLHAATIEFSRNCSSIKRLCVTVLIASCTLLVKLTDGILDPSFFVAGLLIPPLFWGLDATSYFYQEKLRGMINGKLNDIKNRNASDTLRSLEGIVLETHRTKKSRVVRSIFNSSMLLYYILIVINVILFIFFQNGFI